MGESSAVRDQDLRNIIHTANRKRLSKETHVRLGLGIIEWRIDTVRATHTGRSPRLVQQATAHFHCEFLAPQ